MDEGHLLEQFVAESEELIDALGSDLDQLERQRSVGRINPELLNRVFRSAHSLKGMAGMAGIAPVQRVAHRFEDLLDDLRMGRVRPAEGIFSGCAEVTEGLGQMVAAAARGQESDAEAARLVALVDALFEGGPRGAAPEAAPLVDLDDQVRRTLTEYEEHRLAENLRERRPVYDVRVAFDLSEFDVGFRALSDRLAESGEVISTLPGAAADDPLKIAFRIVYAADAPLREVAAVVEPLGGSAALISRYPGPAAGPEPPHDEERGAGEWLEPLSTAVRVDVRALEELASLAGELSLEVAALSARAAEMARRLGLGAREEFDVKQRVRAVERGFLELEERIVDLRLVPLSATFARARRLVHTTAADLGREVEFEAEGDEVRLDKAIVDRVAEPLAHLLLNAVDHGVEPPEARVAAGKPRAGRVTLRAESRGNRVAISVEDDGAGIDPAAVRRAAAERGIALGEGGDGAMAAIFEPGLTTAATDSAVSGRGVGLDAVAAAARELGGEVSVESEPGRGTAFLLTLPTSLVMVSALLVEAAGAVYAIDVNQVEEILIADPAAGQGGALAWRGGEVPVYDLARLVRATGAGAGPAGGRPCLIARAGDRHVAVRVERLAGQREVIVKSLGRHASRLKGVNGAVDLDGRRVALLVDLAALVSEEARVAHG